MQISIISINKNISVIGYQNCQFSSTPTKILETISPIVLPTPPLLPSVKKNFLKFVLWGGGGGGGGGCKL